MKSWYMKFCIYDNYYESSNGEIRRTGRLTGQKFIRSDKSRLFSGLKDCMTMVGKCFCRHKSSGSTDTQV